MTVIVWWAAPSAVRAWHTTLLDPVERGRRERYLREVDRDRFTLGVVLSRLALAEHLDVEPAQVPLTRACPDCAEPHGPPRISGTGQGGPHLSVSHSGDRVAVAVSTHGPLGVDVEIADGRLTGDPAGIAGHLLAAGESATTEAELLTYWTRKEALVKATGDGLREPLGHLRVSAPDAPPRLLDWTGRPELVARFDLRTLAPGDRHHGCLALLDHPAGVAVVEEFYEPSDV